LGLSSRKDAIKEQYPMTSWEGIKPEKFFVTLIELPYPYWIGATQAITVFRISKTMVTYSKRDFTEIMLNSIKVTH
jgi:hypothetical protein